MSRISQALRVRAGGKGAPASEPAESPLDQYDCEEQVADIAEFHPRDAEPMAAPPPGATPPVRVRSNRRSPGDDTEARLVTGTSSTVSIEQYRRLAAMLHEEQVDSGLKVVMLTSALPGEGKTLTAVNVGLTLSESYARRVLIIDADLRVPSVHATFGVPNGRGLSDAIRGEAPLSFTEVSNGLSLLTAGAPGATPLAGLTSPRMKAILEECASRFDWVLIDTPPIGVLPAKGELDLDGLDVSERDLDLLLSVDPEVWKQEAALMPDYFAQFGDRLPQAITDEHAALVKRLEQA